MNKKIIIGLIVAGVVIAGGVYLYSRNKKAKDKKPNLATESQALEMVDLIGKKDEPLSTEKTKNFVDLYMTNIDEDLHKTLMITVAKKESDWTSKDKLNSAILIKKVFDPMSVKK